MNRIMNRPSNLKGNRRKFIPVSVYTLSILALLIFFYGFFPLKNFSHSRARKNIERKSFKPRYVDKLALIVIDALRYDFVMPKNGQNFMPFVLSSIQKNESCCMAARAHSPTVTLPRIKAITTGSVSSYIDVAINFMTTTFEEEDIIHLAVSSGLKLVFYGDGIWLKLFPNSFIRSEGITYFFSNESAQVDYNITRHIDDELKKDDWDVIILHYLGLDLIGHMEGPYSQFVPPKLLEMDAVIKSFNNHFKKLEKHKGLKTMLLVTSDHGMKDTGSHGGVTYSEVTVPVVSIGNSCVDFPGWNEDEMPLQIDLVPTLSTLLGIPIPSSNVGKIIPGLLHNMQKEDILKNLEINRMELRSIINSSDGDSIKSELDAWLLSKDNKLGINIAKKYYQTLNQISQKLVSSRSGFELLGFLLFGVASLWICSFYLLFEFLIQWPNPKTYIHWFFIVGSFTHGFTLVSTSFIEEEHQTWYFFWITFCVFIILEGLRRKPLLARPLIAWIIVAVAHRVLRKLNQTGNKWAALPDIKLYLYSEEGHPWLLILFLLGVGMVFSYCLIECCSISQRITYGISLLAVICYRFAIGNFRNLTIQSSYRGFSEIIVFWICSSLFTIQTALNKTPCYLIWLLVNSLLLRPHNIILPPIQVFISVRLHKLFSNSENAVLNNIAHIWLGNVFYFYQGNGNSLSNVDITAGFTRNTADYPIYICVTVAAHTFSSHILSYILSPKHDLVFALVRIIPVTVYCTALIFNLNHLFIWSVFSPKLIYEVSMSVLLLILMFGHSLLYFRKFRWF